MSAACPRSFEVEALRDGRLNGVERVAFERHLARCEACSHEAAALTSLAEALRSDHGRPTDELHVRRVKTRLLAAFARAPGPESRSAKVRRLVALAAAAAVLLGILLLLRGRPMTSMAEVAIQAGPGAEWSRRPDGHRDVVALARGELRIQVTHGSGQPRLLVRLPDGELEDIGTTFVVAVEGGSTRRVSVEEGSVTVRLRGRSAGVIRAGETWTSTPVMAPFAGASAAPERVPPTARTPPASLPGVSGVPARGLAVTPPPAVSTPQVGTGSVAQPSASSSAASDDFREAVAALHRGENVDAARRFVSFLAHHPQDARCEDAAYLRVLALERSGNEAAAKTAAREYLRRYPKGFRRSEVERLASGED